MEHEARRMARNEIVRTLVRAALYLSFPLNYLCIVSDYRRTDPLVLELQEQVLI